MATNVTGRGCLVGLLLVVAVIAGSVWWTMANEEALDELDAELNPAPMQAVGSITKCEWTEFPDSIGWVEVNGQVTSSEPEVENIALDVEYRVAGQVVAATSGVALDVQPGQTATWVAVFQDVQAGGECFITRVY